MVRRWRRVSDLPEANPYVRANSLRLDKNQIMGPHQLWLMGRQVRMPISELKNYLREKLAY